MYIQLINIVTLVGVITEMFVNNINSIRF